MTFDPFEEVAEVIDENADEKEAEEAKKERREVAKYYVCNIARVFTSQRELRDFLNSEGLADDHAIVKGHQLNPKKKVVYTI